MTMSLEAAAGAMREAMRETVKRHSLWYLIQGALMVLGGVLALVYLLLIVFFMVEGISKLVFALTIRPFPNWGWVLASGVIGILLSLFLWASFPVTAIWLLGVLLGIHLWIAMFVQLLSKSHCGRWA